MAITYVGGDKDRQGTGGTSNLGLVIPTHAIDDVGIVFCRSSGTSMTFTMDTAGWTELVQERPSNFYGNCAIYYRVFTSSSETDPVISHSDTFSRSVTLQVFRGVDSSVFDATYQSASNNNDATPTSPAITTTTDDACVLLFHAGWRDDITTNTAPSGYTLGENDIGDPISFGWGYHIATAYLLDVGASGTETPGAWAHTATADNDYAVYTLALKLNVTTHTGNGSFTGDGALSGSSLVSKVAEGSTTSSVTLVGTSLVSKVAVGSVNASATLVGSGVKILNTTGSIQVVASLQGDGTTTQVFSGSGSIGTAVALSGNVTVGIKSEGSIITSSILSGNAISILKAYVNVNTSVHLTGVVGLKVSAAGNINTISTLAGGYTFHKVSKGTDTIYTTQTPTQTIYIVGEET